MDQTRCDFFGHKFALWKEGGESYMRCEYCPAVMPIIREGATLREYLLRETAHNAAEAERLNTVE